MRRHPQLRKTFREEPAESKTELALQQDKNKDVVEERVRNYWAELKRQGVSVTIADLDEIDSNAVVEELTGILESRGYKVTGPSGYRI
jgi:hypothetical protein